MSTNMFPEYLSIVPIQQGTKFPAVQWTREGTLRPFDPANYQSFAAITGMASQGLEVLDFDSKCGYDPEWALGVFLANVGKIDQRLADSLYIQSTPSGGRHVMYRYDGGGMVPTEPMLCARYYGGQLAMVPPTEGYAPLQNTLATIPRITLSERNLLVSISRQHSVAA